MNRKVKSFIKRTPCLLGMAKKYLYFRSHIKAFFPLYRLRWFYRGRKEFIKKQDSHDTRYYFKEITTFPYLKDIDANAGACSFYLLQDLWAAKKISSLPREKEHYDIGSRIDGFIAHLLSFRENITIVDIRPYPYKISNSLNFIQDDATNLARFESGSVFSISALCSLEHFGLGRYGDQIDPNACFEAFDAIQRVLVEGGYAYISVPIGRERIEFNAHRIFCPRTIVTCFNQMELIEFSVAQIDEDMPIIYNADLDGYNNVEHLFGLFEFRKKANL